MHLAAGHRVSLMSVAEGLAASATVSALCGSIRLESRHDIGYLPSEMQGRRLSTKAWREGKYIAPSFS